jgi:hypothetical protein
LEISANKPLASDQYRSVAAEYERLYALVYLYKFELHSSPDVVPHDRKNSSMRHETIIELFLMIQTTMTTTRDSAAKENASPLVNRTAKSQQKKKRPPLGEALTLDPPPKKTKTMKPPPVLLPEERMAKKLPLFPMLEELPDPGTVASDGQFFNKLGNETPQNVWAIGKEAWATKRWAWANSRSSRGILWQRANSPVGAKKNSAAPPPPEGIEPATVPVTRTEVIIAAPPGPLWQRANELRRAASDARKVALSGSLAEVIASRDKNDPFRYKILQDFGLLIAAEKYKLAEQDKTLLEERLLNNEEESTLCRAYAAYFLAHCCLHQTCTDGIVYYQHILDLCDGASTQERRSTVPGIKNADEQVLVGKILDNFQKLAEEAIKIRSQKNQFTGLCREHEVEEFKTIILALHGPNGMKFCQIISQPPAITTTVMEQVNALPEKDVTLLILPDAGLCALADGASKLTSRAFTVDLERFQRGKKKGIFTQLQQVSCDPDQTLQKNTLQKNILSTFVAACLDPYALFPKTTHAHPSARPRHVLLQGVASSKDPHVLFFLSKMGCTEVQAADPALLTLLNERRDDVLAETERYVYAGSPLLCDVLQGIKCGNCGMYGPKNKCLCGEVYYCSNECQSAKWKEHKSEHKSALARKNAKMDK